jgi:ubiquitin-protein ligase E3 A
MTDLLEELS